MSVNIPFVAAERPPNIGSARANRRGLGGRCGAVGHCRFAGAASGARGERPGVFFFKAMNHGLTIYYSYL